MSVAKYAIAVVCRNEAESIGKCLDALRDETDPIEASVDIFVNGSTDATEAIAVAAAPRFRYPARVHRIAFADKSNAINQFLHRIAGEADTYLFVDGYAEITPGSLAALGRCLSADGRATAATALPSIGRSAALLRQQMIERHDLHGTLFALKGDLVERIRQQGYSLPVGLYRGDGLLGSMIRHDLDPLRNEWDPARIAVCAEASWRVRAPSPLRLSDYRRHFNRLVQQARGRIESAAIKDIVYEKGYSGLPRYADDMLCAWLERHPSGHSKLDIFHALAVHRLTSPRRPTDDELTPLSISGRVRQ